MNLKKLQSGIDRFREFLKGPERFTALYKYESLKNWQEHWDLDASDLAGVFDQSLESRESRRLWRSDQYFPKDSLLVFLKLDKEFVRMMFRDLFQEGRTVSTRIDRFIFHCDALLDAWREDHPQGPLRSHYHGDLRMVSLYLAFRYPEQYTLYRFEAFRDFLTALESRDIPLVHDPERFFKVMRTVDQFLTRDVDLLQLHGDRLDPSVHFTGKSLLLVHEFFLFLSGRSTGD